MATVPDDDIAALDEEVTVLPWWRSPLNLLLVLLVACMVASGIGWALGRSTSDLAHNEVDTGFLQDMRVHHEQAVVMSMLYLDVAPDGPFPLRDIAREIMMSQATEIGRMVQMLRLFSEAETNETDQAMAWMGEPTPLLAMPGLASEAELERLRRSTGSRADSLFATLMIAHHKGGVHMAEHAASFADNAEVKAMARAMVKAQASEIYDLGKFVAP